MTLTHGSNVFNCTFEQAKLVADCAGLIYVLGDRYPFLMKMRDWTEKHPYPGHISLEWENAMEHEEQRIKNEMLVPREHADYSMWYDRQTGGGGARIVFDRGVAWVSCHSGYPWADITEEVAELFREIGCQELDNAMVWRSNPYTYGFNNKYRNILPISE